MWDYSDFRTDTLIDGAADDASSAIRLLSDNKHFMRKLTRPVGLSKAYQEGLARKIDINRKVAQQYLESIQEIGEEMAKRGDDEAMTAIYRMVEQLEARLKRGTINAD